MCLRISSGSAACIAVLIYRTGTIKATFFDELAQILDSVTTYYVPVTVAGDFNVRFERLDDPHGSKLREVMSTYGLVCSVNQPTHQLGGTLDLVFSPISRPLNVTVSDPGLSDHFLLNWPTLLPLPRLLYATTTYRPRSRLDRSEFRCLLSESPLCRPESWPHLNVDELANLYRVTISRILDALIPFKTSRRPKRPSDPWYDGECRDAKLIPSVRKLERRLQGMTSGSNHLSNQ